MNLSTNCKCGGRYGSTNKTNHLKTIKHRRYLGIYKETKRPKKIRILLKNKNILQLSDFENFKIRMINERYELRKKERKIRRIKERAKEFRERVMDYRLDANMSELTELNTRMEEMKSGCKLLHINESNVISESFEFVMNDSKKLILEGILEPLAKIFRDKVTKTLLDKQVDEVNISDLIMSYV